MLKALPATGEAAATACADPVKSTDVAQQDRLLLFTTNVITWNNLHVARW